MIFAHYFIILASEITAIDTMAKTHLPRVLVLVGFKVLASYKACGKATFYLNGQQERNIVKTSSLYSICSPQLMRARLIPGAETVSSLDLEV